MKTFLKNCHLPENLEVLFMLIIGILLQMTDGSPFSMKERWMLVWATELPAEYFSPLIQQIIKTILSVIVVVRCSTTYAYVVSAMLVIFCLVKKTSAKLMLLWLLVAGVKSILMTFFEALTGVYVCSAFGKIRKACIEFFISKALEIIFAAYLWGNVLNIYQDMDRKAQKNIKDPVVTQKMDFGRLRARSLLDESTLYRTACLNNFEFKDVPQIILQMLRRDDEMSQDSLLGPGMMLASVSTMGSFENLKTSQSLGELGFTDLQTAQVEGLEDDGKLSFKEQALRFLKLSTSEVNRIKTNRTPLEKDIYTVGEDVWKRVIASGRFLNKPKQARTEVFIREISQEDLSEEKIVKTQNLSKIEYTFGFSLSNLFMEKQFAIQDNQNEEEGSQSDSPEDEESGDDETPSNLFMSNIKEGTIVQRHRFGIMSKKAKGNEYAHLYKQDFMSSIGPEVFDKATKLPRVTSLTRKTNGIKTRVAISSPVLQNTNETNSKVYEENRKENELNSHSNLYTGGAERHDEENLSPDTLFSSEIVEESFSREEKYNKEEHSIEKEKMVEQNSQGEKEHQDLVKTENLVDALELESVEKESETPEKLDNQEKNCETISNLMNVKENKEDKIILPTVVCSDIDVSTETATKPCFRKRKIIIKRINKTKESTLLCNSSFSSQGSSINSDSGSDIRPKSNFCERDEKNKIEHSVRWKTSGTNEWNKTEESKKNSLINENEDQVYFLIQLLQKPFVDVLMTYYDLKNKVHVNRKSSIDSQKRNKELVTYLYQNKNLNRCEKILDSLEFHSKDKKIWKSKVLKSVESWNNQNSSLTSRSYLELLRKKSIIKKLLKYEVLYFLKKGKHAFKEENELFAQILAKDRHKMSNINTDRSFSIIDTSSSFSKAKCGISVDFQKKSTELESLSFPSHIYKENKETVYIPSKTSCEIGVTEFICNKISKETLANADDLKSPNIKTERNEIRTDEEETKQKLEKVTPSSGALNNDPEGSLCSQESDEPISLYYSKAANLASPLLDMKRFIYPDHIHYSYKHVKKKGFDVDISGGFPLLVRENLTVTSPAKIKNGSEPPNQECEIKRRPMDLSFANTDAFAEWKNDVYLVRSKESRPDVTDILSLSKNEPSSNFIKNKKSKKNSRKPKNESNENRPFIKSELMKLKSKSYGQDKKYLYHAEDYALIEKLIKMHKQFNSNGYKKFNDINKEMSPIQISSTQLHSNKGRNNSTYNPAISLQENKSRNEKKKIETQEKRTSDMFARLKREALLQSKNVPTSNQKSV